MRFSLLVCLLIGFALRLAAQSGPLAWRLEGRVSDDAGEAVIGATIAADGVLRAISDTDGRFAFELPERPDERVVRQIGYFARRIPLDTLSYVRQRAFIDIRLSSSAMELPEVGVTGKAVEVLFEENNRSRLLDYIFAGPDLLLLFEDRGQTWLHLTTDDGRVLDRLRLPVQTTTLHHSCTGGLHACGPEWAWEVTLNGQKLDTFPRYAAALFQELIAPCMLEVEGNYVFRQGGSLRQSVRYFYYDPAHQPHILAFIRDEAAEEELMRRYREILVAYMQTIPDVDKDDILNDQTRWTDLNRILNPEQLAQMAETNALVSAIGYFQLLAQDSVYAPLFRTDSTLLLFDHINDVMHTYRFDPLRDQVQPIDYHLADGWKKEMIADEATQRIYARFAGKGGVLVLKEIDPATGAVRKKYTPSGAPYLSARYRMRAGYLYCIGQNSANDPNRRLFKVNLFKE